MCAKKYPLKAIISKKRKNKTKTLKIHRYLNIFTSLGYYCFVTQVIYSTIQTNISYGSP